jgi:hypothetical protein
MYLSDIGLDPFRQWFHQAKSIGYKARAEIAGIGLRDRINDNQTKRSYYRLVIGTLDRTPDRWHRFRESNIDYGPSIMLLERTTYCLFTTSTKYFVTAYLVNNPDNPAMFRKHQPMNVFELRSLNLDKPIRNLQELGNTCESRQYHYQLRLRMPYDRVDISLYSRMRPVRREHFRLCIRVVSICINTHLCSVFNIIVYIRFS